MTSTKDTDVVEVYSDVNDVTTPGGAALLRRSFRDSALYRNFLHRFSARERKEILNGKYLRILSDYASRNPKSGRDTRAPFVRDEVWPPIQNWNGNLYHGSPAVILSLQMLSHPEWLPVFLTNAQCAAMGLNPVPKAGTLVVHRESMASLPIVSRVYNIAETDFPVRYPFHYATLRETLREAHLRDLEENAAAVNLPSGIDEAVKEAASKEPGMNVRSKDCQDIMELAKGAVSRMAAPRATYYPSGVTGSRYVSNLDYQSAYRLVRTAGRVALAAEKALGLGKTRGLDMDEFIRHTNRKFSEMTKAQEESRANAPRI